LLNDFLESCGREKDWLDGKTVVTIGCGCTGDLAVWPAAVKIAIDPLLNTYKKLGMLLEDSPGTGRTVFLSVGAEEIPLLDESADIALCRNALDHMLEPRIGIEQISRILKEAGLLYLSVDIGGPVTPDEPSPFTRESLSSLLQDYFEVLSQSDGHPPHDNFRDYSCRLLLKKTRSFSAKLDKGEILRSYEASIGHVKRAGFAGGQFV
jgi:ubiquinone/menaquinone biosynthesis C-methylase UbiE